MVFARAWLWVAIWATGLVHPGQPYPSGTQRTVATGHVPAWHPAAAHRAGQTRSRPGATYRHPSQYTMGGVAHVRHVMVFPLFCPLCDSALRPHVLLGLS